MKRISVALIILVILIISIIPISYALDGQENKFFEVNKTEISKGETLEMTINIEKIEYPKAIFKISSNSNINEVYNEDDIDLEKSEQAITIEIDKEKLNLNQIKLYYKIPEKIEIGTTINLKALIENAEDSEQNQNIETTVKIVEKQENEADTDKTQMNEKNENTLADKENVVNNNKKNDQIMNNEISENTAKTIQMAAGKSNSSVSENQEIVTYNGSCNNYLSELSVKGYELNKVFNKESSTYFVTVGNDISELNINAIAEDEESIVCISGAENLENGTNKILIAVTAENGNVRNYKIYVTKNS